MQTRTWIGISRIVLGVLLIWKGLLFIQDVSLSQTVHGFSEVIAAVISITTLVVGIALMMGFFTRTVSYVQIVMLLCALIFIFSNNIQRPLVEELTTVLIFYSLVFFARKGSGAISFDDFR